VGEESIILLDLHYMLTIALFWVLKQSIITHSTSNLSFICQRLFS